MSETDLLARCRAIPVSTWSDALDHFDVWGVVQGMTLHSGAGRVCGFAVTARQMPGRLHEFEKAEFAVGRIVSASAPGKVLMVDVGGEPISTMGGLAAYGAKQLGVEAVVIDGACRDVDEIRKTGLWLASRWVAPTTGKGRLRLLPLGGPVTIGGIVVQQDDLVVGDETGIVVVPRALVAEALPKAEALMAADQAVEERMLAGETFAAAGAATGYLYTEGLSGVTASTVLQLAPIGPLADALLRDELGAVRLWEQEDGWLEAHGAGVAMLATSVRRGCNAAMIAALPALRVISSWGVGYDTLEVDEAHARGIQVANTPDVLDDCVADLAWGLLIATARRIPAADRYARAGQWVDLGEFPLTTRVSGKRLGILGLGRIGTAIARRGHGFDMQVRYHGRAPKDVPYGFESSLRELAAWSDFLVVACGGGPQTRHLVSAPVLEALGPRGILVNIGRGSVVDQAALITALEAGTLGGAGLDVFQGEPGVPEALCRRDNVVISPHVGSATFETREAMERLVVDNLHAFLRDGRVLTPILP